MFKLCSIPIRCNLSFLLIGLLVLLNSGNLYLALLALIALGISLLSHELGHCLVARKFGYDIHDIILTMLGGCASITQTRLMKSSEEIKVAFAGPCVSFILAIISFPIAMLLYIIGTYIPLIGNIFIIAYNFFGVMFVINLMLGIFNLIPAFPMDGGRILRAFLSKKRSHLAATELAIKIAKGIAIVLGVIALLTILFGNMGGLTTGLIAAFIWFAGEAELRNERMIYGRI